MTDKELENIPNTHISALSMAGDYSGIDTGTANTERLDLQIEAADRKVRRLSGTIPAGGEVVLSSINFPSANSIDANGLRNRN